MSNHRVASEVASGLVDLGIVTVNASREERTAADAALSNVITAGSNTSADGRSANAGTRVNPSLWPLWSKRLDPFQRHQAICFAQREAGRWRRSLRRLHEELEVVEAFKNPLETPASPSTDGGDMSPTDRDEAAGE